MASQCCIVVGAGSGTGAEIAKVFSREGYAVAVARRDVAALAPLVGEIEGAGGKAEAFGVDAANEAAVVDLFDTAESRLGEVEVVVFNAAGFLMAPALDTSVDDFEGMWKASALGGFLVGREAVRRMVPRCRGTLLFTGATAATKASASFAAFAAGKHGLRATAQSLAKEFGPRGIHVAHLIVDGMIDVPRVREQMPELVKAKGSDGLLEPASIANTYLWIHRQPRDAWTFEMDLRPWCEKW